MSEAQYVPEFDLVIDGQEILDGLRGSISGVTFTTGLEGADRVEVQIANQHLRWLDHPLLAPDLVVELHLGYAGSKVKVFHGETTAVSASFPADNLPRLTLTAQDRRHRLQKGAKGRVFVKPAPGVNIPVPDIEVGKQIAGRHGLVASFDPLAAGLAALVGQALALAGGDPAALQKDATRQIQETDEAVLGRIAKKNGLEVVIEHTGPDAGRRMRFFSPLDRLTPEVTLAYGVSLIDFTPRENKAGQESQVTANVWLSAVKKRVGVTLGTDPARPGGLLLQIRPGAPADDSAEGGLVLDEALTPATAPGRLLGELLPRLNQRLTGSGSTVGDTRFRAGTVIRIEGVGARFGGYWRVTSATHTLDQGGYRTSFEVRKEVWFELVPKDVQGAVRVAAPFRVKV